MNRSKKGVSMISLVIIIVVTVILLGTAITAGYRYIELGKRTRAQALGLTIGSAAYRRQNDVSTGVSERYYDGYAFDLRKEANYLGETVNKYKYIQGIPSGDLYSGDILFGGEETPNGIPDVLEGNDRMWFLLDAETAEMLGAPGADELLTRNISYQMTSSRPQGDTVKVVLADYSTGDGYYVTIPVDILNSCVNNDVGECPNSVNGRHKFTIVTCTEDSVCIFCGAKGTSALGHDFSSATCTAPGSCRRCGTITTVSGDKEIVMYPALGHSFIANTDVTANTDPVKKVVERGDVAIINSSDPAQAWITNSTKHWHECARCGVKFEDEEHTISGYIVDELNDPLHHYRMCSICGWSSIRALHTYGDPVIATDTTHKRTCVACLTEVNHAEKLTVNPHTNEARNAWFADCENFHYRVCDDDPTCNKLAVITDSGVQITAVFKEAHIDDNRDYYCDVCGRKVDREPPQEFNDEDYKSFFKVKSANTYSITLEAYTVDSQMGIDYYQFGIYNLESNKVNWNSEKVYPGNEGVTVTTTFSGLKHNSPYTFYVRAFDTEGNANTPAKEVGYTKDFPEFAGISELPSKVVKGPIQVGINEIETDLDNLFVQYQQNGGVWSDDIPLSSLRTSKVTLALEEERLDFRLKDIKGNISDKTWTYYTNNIDNTPPSITITNKLGDNNNLSVAQHFATVTVADNKGKVARAGLAQKTEIQYGWSTSRVLAPAEFTTIYTENTSTVESVTFDVGTPIGANGTYYLWIKQGVKDAVGNATPEDVKCSEALPFVVDDTEATVSEITMINEHPDYQVPDEHLFVKTNGEVIVTFKVDKRLRQNPIVRINGQDMIINRTTDDGLNYRCSLVINSSFEEGTLQLFIGDIVSVNGRLSERTYSNADIVNGKGPVYYDKTPPVIEYIPKKTP